MRRPPRHGRKNPTPCGGLAGRGRLGAQHAGLSFAVASTMALTHYKPGQPMPVAPLGVQLPQASTHALLKTPSLELIRIVMRAGEALPPHQVRGELTLQCIEGEVEVSMDGQVCLLRAHELLLMSPQVQHALRAQLDSSLLLTIQLPPGTPGSASSTS
jgi:quercetin dioxygenase-like cupin family protein